jgi:hypothetical protein
MAPKVAEKGAKVMLLGLGLIGGPMLESLARTPGIASIYVCRRDQERALDQIENARIGAALEGRHPEIRFVKLDINDIEGSAEVIGRIKPEVILNAASLQSAYFLQGKIPESLYYKVNYEAGIAPWVPIHLVVLHKLMKAVKRSKSNAPVVNVSVPDITHAVLQKVGLAPTVGAGNVSHYSAKIRVMVSDKLKIPVGHISVSMIFHHGEASHIRATGKPSGAPVFLRVYHNGSDITSKLNVQKLLVAAVRLPPVNLPASLLVSSTIRNALALLSESGATTNAPGPSGLPGGWPVKLDRRGAHVQLPSSLTMEEAVRMVEAQQLGDGIESIGKDGTVILTPKSHRVMKEALGIDHQELGLQEMEPLAQELISKSRELLKKSAA